MGTNQFNNNDIFVHTSFETYRLYGAYQRANPFDSPEPMFHDYYPCVPAPSILVVFGMAFAWMGRRKRRD